MKAFKGCINTDCRGYKKIKYKNDDEFCKKCGQPLSHVCADCWKPLETDENRFCTSCQAKRDQQLANRKATLKKSVTTAGGVATGAVAFIVKNPKQLKEGAQVAVEIGGKIIRSIPK